eukprot:gene18756-22399_t
MAPLDVSIAVSSTEKKALQSMKKRMTEWPVMPTSVVKSETLDATLLRFLRAKKLNVDKALKMLQGTINWRVVNQVDNILQEVAHQSDCLERVRRVRQAHPRMMSGTDSKGRPIYIERLHYLKDYLRPAGDLTESDLFYFHVYDME